VRVIHDALKVALPIFGRGCVSEKIQFVSEQWKVLVARAKLPICTALGKANRSSGQLRVSACKLKRKMPAIS